MLVRARSLLSGTHSYLTCNFLRRATVLHRAVIHFHPAAAFPWDVGSSSRSIFAAANIRIRHEAVGSGAVRLEDLNAGFLTFAGWNVTSHFSNHTFLREVLSDKKKPVFVLLTFRKSVSRKGFRFFFKISSSFSSSFTADNPRLSG